MEDGTQSEWGTGTITAGSPDTISRDNVIGNSANTTSRLNFTGLTYIYNELCAENTVYRNSSGVYNLTTVSGVNPTSMLNLTATTNGNGAGITFLGNGATTPAKTVRVAGGVYQILNNAYSSVLWSMDDAGAVTMQPGGSFLGNGSATGYQKLPSGVIIQWGVNTLTATSSTISYAIPFPNSQRAVVITPANPGGNPMVNTYGTSSFSAQVGAGQACAITWIAIGY